MRIRHHRYTPLPDTGDSTRVQPSDWNADHVIDVDIITENTTFTVGTTADFNSVTALFNHLNGLMVKPDVRIVVDIQPGIHEGGAVDNNRCSNVHLIGADPVPLTVVSATVSGNAGSRQVAYAIDAGVTIPATVVPGAALVYHNFGDDDWVNLGHFGSHTITAVDFDNCVITVLNTNVGDVPDFTAQSISGVHVLTSVIRCTNAQTAALTVSGGSKGDYGDPYMKNLAIDANHSAMFAFRVRNGAYVNMTGSGYYTVAFLNANNINVLAEDRSSIVTGDYSVVSSTSQTGVMSNRGSLIDLANGSIISGCQDGFVADMCSHGILEGALIVDAANGVAAQHQSRIRYWAINNRSYISQATMDQAGAIE